MWHEWGSEQGWETEHGVAAKTDPKGLGRPAQEGTGLLEVTAGAEMNVRVALDKGQRWVARRPG